jgi:hypothetical protein
MCVISPYILASSEKQKISQQRLMTVKNIDACVIRTHAPEGNALAGHRVNHSAKAPKSVYGNNSRDWLDLGSMKKPQTVK